MRRRGKWRERGGEGAGKRKRGIGKDRRKRNWKEIAKQRGGEGRGEIGKQRRQRNEGGGKLKKTTKALTKRRKKRGEGRKEEDR